MHRRRPIELMSIGFGIVGVAGPLHAELGGGIASIEADRAHIAATMARSGAANYDIYTLTPADGGLVREYATGGTVFAVSWEGPARPDLRQLLGTRFAMFQSAGSGWAGRRMRRHVAMRQSGFVVRSAGHPGAFHGVAYVPALLPQGFTGDAIR